MKMKIWFLLENICKCTYISDMKQNSVENNGLKILYNVKESQEWIRIYSILFSLSHIHAKNCKVNNFIVSYYYNFNNGNIFFVFTNNADFSLFQDYIKIMQCKLCNNATKLELRYFRRRISLIVTSFSLSYKARTGDRIFYFIGCNVAGAQHPFLQIFSPSSCTPD